MLIDWFSVGTQAVNFLLLLYLLKRFLYGPILQAMDKREQAIRDRLDAAEKTRMEAETSAAEYQKKRNELEEKSALLMAEAETDAEQRGKQLIALAKAEAEGVRSSWSESVQREQVLFLAELKKRTATEILRISRKTMTDLAGADLQPQLVKILLKKLTGLQQTQKNKCAAAATKVPPEVRTSFTLDALQKKTLTAVLQAVCDDEVPVTYTADSAMPFGIDVVIGELRFSWGVEQYFEDLEKNVADLLRSSAPPVAASFGTYGDV